MHICIPDTRELRPPHGSAYLLYNVHIDGLYHCSLRFKQLLHLHQALSKKFAAHQMPPFPPKKLLPLSANQVEDRRQQLEKYLQSISQDKTISQSSMFNLFLLEAQRESTRIEERHEHLDIELVNGQKIRLPLMTHDSADSVLTAVCRALKLADQYHAYFCLCLCGYDVVRDKLIIKRKLSFFEAPFITLQMAIQQQEQLHSMLNGFSSHPVGPYASNGDTSSSGNTAALVTNRQTIGSNNLVNINNNSEMTCSCLNCSQSVQHSTRQLATDATLAPYDNYSTGAQANNDTNLINQRAPCNGGENNNIYYDETTSNNGANSIWRKQHHQMAVSHSSATATGTGPRFPSRPTHHRQSFVTHRILLRKSYWDPIYDSYILNDQQALNLLFIQTVYDMKHSLMFVDRDTYQRLEALLAADAKLEYIQLARNLKYYNYVHFEPCYSDYPRPHTKVMISIGSKELNMRVLKNPRSITPPLASTPAAAQADLMQPETSSPSTSSQATPQAAPKPVSKTNQGEQPVLYCTSTLVPSGYHELITKDDLIEEEYNFKVPLIRCWRLTSLETFSSANHNQQQQQLRQATNTLAGGKRKSFSLFNSVLGNSTNSSPAQGINHRQHQQVESRSHSSNSGGSSDGRGPITGNLISSGTGGQSLMSTLISNSERDSRNKSSNGNNYSHKSANDGRSFSPFRSNTNNDSHHLVDHPLHPNSAQQFCSHENCRQHHHHHQQQSRLSSEAAEYQHRPVNDVIDQTQLSQYELSFEYLVSKDKLKWITISSDQAIFISISLQGVVDELVSKRDSLLAAAAARTTSDLVGDSMASLTISQTNGSQQHHQAFNTPAPSYMMHTASANASTPPISIMSPRNDCSLSGKRQKLSDSFTYLYRDGVQKLLKTQSIDRFFAALGNSPPCRSSYSSSRRTSGSIATTGVNSLPQSAPTNSRHSTTMTQPGGFWNLDTRAMATSPSRYLFGGGQPSGHSTFDIANTKKAPSPIINDAFEGVANDDEA